MKINPDIYRRLIDIGRALSAEKNIDNLLERILQEAKSMANADAGTLYLRTNYHALQFAIVLNDTLKIHQGGKSGTPVSLPDIPLVLEDGEPNLKNIATRSACTGETINIEDVYSASDIDTSGTRHFDDLTGYRSKSFLTVPLRNYRGETIGILQLLNALDEDGEPTFFPHDMEPLIEALASQAAVALENRYLLDEQEDLKRQLEREVDERTEELKSALEKLSEAHIILKELTTIDAVTGIRNRQYFDEVYNQEWRRAVRQQYPMTIMLLDIDHFKRVNDTYGHLAGDECLSAVAKDVDSMFNRPSDVVARYGGEEFIVILPYVEIENARTLAEQVRRRIETHSMEADGHKISVTISVGIASLIPSDGIDPKVLVGNADVALYQAKSGGRNRVVAFDEVE
ncbi:MAG TPA: sensor domain-containing diguanylate cyclase [Pseudomonadales bacterium]|nr:sensor domain-containing diguanylate cyclase [Pseudomonadales bacterium]